MEKEVKAYKLEANRLFQEASAFLNQDKDEQALKKFRAARDTYTLPAGLCLKALRRPRTNKAILTVRHEMEFLITAANRFFRRDNF